MALVTESFDGDGVTETFTVSNEVLSKSHVRVHYYYDLLDHEVVDDDWDLLGKGTIVFIDAPTSGYIVKITTSTDGTGLETAPSDLNTLAAMTDEIAILADSLSTVVEFNNNYPTGITYYVQSEVDSKDSLLQSGIDANLQAISSLASASGSFVSNVGGYPFAVSPTPTIMQFDIENQSSNLDILQVNVDNTVTLKIDTNYTFISSVTFEDTTGPSLLENITFNIIDVSDDSILATKTAEVEISGGNTLVVPVHALLPIVGSPVTVRFEAISDGSGYSINDFTSILASQSSSIYSVLLATDDIDFTGNNSFSQAVELKSASGGIHLVAEDGAGNADVTIPRAGVVEAGTLKEIGVGQTWQNVKATGPRALGTTYTNTTGKPIMVGISCHGYNNTWYIQVSGVTVLYNHKYSYAGYYDSAIVIVPNGETYKAVNGSAGVHTSTLSHWAELR